MEERLILLGKEEQPFLLYQSLAFLASVSQNYF